MEYVTEIQKINSSIMFGNFSNDQLDSIIMAVKFAKSQLAKQTKNTVVRGSQVKFTSTRTGQVLFGEVTDVKRKFIHIRTNHGDWRVPANMVSSI